MFPPSQARILWRRIIDRVDVVKAWGVFAVSLRRRRERELWIGDSHTVAFNRSATYAMFVPAPHGQLIVRTGARLMYSLARDGFPGRVRRLAKCVQIFGRPGSFVPVFLAGEIDVRNHLSRYQGTGFGFVERYVGNAAALSRELSAERFYVVVPPPPAARAIVRDLPVEGTDEERVLAFRTLRTALQQAVAACPSARLVDFTDLLATSNGLFDPAFTDDGCHVNPAGQEVVRRAVTNRSTFAA